MRGNRPSLRKAAQVFKYRNYRLLWVSSTFSFTGMQMQQVARALLAWELTQSFAAVGAISLSFGMPMLLLALIGGAIADRVEKRNLTLMTQAATGILALLTAILVSTNLITIEILFAVGLVQGTFFALGMPARTPLMAECVDSQDLMSAIAMSNASMNFTRLFGPAVAGAVIAASGIDAAYYVQAGAYVFSVATLLFVPTGISALANGGVARRPEGGMFAEIGRGLRYVWGDGTLRLLIAMMFIPALFAMPYVVLLAGFVQEDLGKGASAFGFLQSVSGAGALVGSLAIATLTDFDRKPVVQWVAGLLGGAGLILMSVGSMSFGYSGAIAATLVLGLSLTAYQTLNNTMVMDAARPEYYGRVMSINMLTFSMMPIMATPLGMLADRVGASELFLIQGAIVIGFMVLVAVANTGYTFGRVARPAWKEALEPVEEPIEAAAAS